MESLSRAKEYVSDMELLEIAVGFPQYKDDGNEFSVADYAHCMKETVRVHKHGCMFSPDLCMDSKPPVRQHSASKTRPSIRDQLFEKSKGGSRRTRAS